MENINYYIFFSGGRRCHLTIRRDMKNLYGILFAFLMAFSDLFNLGLLKMLRTGQVSNMVWLGLPVLVYALQPVIFFFGLKYTSLTVLNLLWDVISDILVTVAGIFYFKESITFRQTIGIVFAMIAVVLLSSD